MRGKIKLDPREQSDERGIKLGFYLASGPAPAKLREAAKRYHRSEMWVARKLLILAIEGLKLPAPDEYADLAEEAAENAARRRQAAIKGMMQRSNHASA